jgi:hypothetical protein
MQGQKATSWFIAQQAHSQLNYVITSSNSACSMHHQLASWFISSLLVGP